MAGVLCIATDGGRGRIIVDPVLNLPHMCTPVCRFCINAAALHFVADDATMPKFMAALNRYIFV